MLGTIWNSIPENKETFGILDENKQLLDELLAKHVDKTKEVSSCEEGKS